MKLPPKLTLKLIMDLIYVEDGTLVRGCVALPCPSGGKVYPEATTRKQQVASNASSTLGSMLQHEQIHVAPFPGARLMLLVAGSEH